MEKAGPHGILLFAMPCSRMLTTLTKTCVLGERASIPTPTMCGKTFFWIRDAPTRQSPLAYPRDRGVTSARARVYAGNQMAVRVAKWCDCEICKVDQHLKDLFQLNYSGVHC
jgi:hypothetical protein